MYDYAKRPKSMTRDMIDLDFLRTVSDRIKQVQIECCDAFDVIKKYDNPGALIYVDPPYTKSVRRNKSYYEHEWDDQKHIDAFSLLNKAQGLVVVSGYKSPMYKDLYEGAGWTRKDIKSVAQKGATRIESVWLSPRTVAALAMPVQQLIF